MVNNNTITAYRGTISKQNLKYAIKSNCEREEAGA